jgi:hypothetical protein
VVIFSARAIVARLLGVGFVLQLASCLGSLIQGPLQRRNELLQANPERSAERPQFNYVDAPLASFALANKRLRLANPAGKLRLSETRFLAGLLQDLQKNRVTSRVDGFFHCVPGRSKRNEIRLQPKIE